MRCIVAKRAAAGAALSAAVALAGCAALAGRGESPARVGHDPFTDAQRVDIRPHATKRRKGGDDMKKYQISLGGYWDATAVDKARIEILAVGPDYLNLSDASFDIEDRPGDRPERVNAPGIATTRFGESVRSEGTFLSVRSFSSDMELVTRIASAHAAVLLVNTPSGLFRRQIVRGDGTSPAFHAMRRFLGAVQQVGLDVDGFKYVRRPDPIPELVEPVEEVAVLALPDDEEPASAPEILVDEEFVPEPAEPVDAPVEVASLDAFEAPSAEVPPAKTVDDDIAAIDELISGIDALPVDEALEVAPGPLGDEELLDEMERAVEGELPAPTAATEPIDDLLAPRPSVPVVEGDAPLVGIEDLSVPEPQMTQAEMEAELEAQRLAALQAEEERRRQDFERQLELARVQNVREVILRDIELMVSRDAERLIMKDAQQVRQP